MALERGGAKGRTKRLVHTAYTCVTSGGIPSPPDIIVHVCSTWLIFISCSLLFAIYCHDCILAPFLEAPAQEQKSSLTSKCSKQANWFTWLAWSDTSKPTIVYASSPDQLFIKSRARADDQASCLITESEAWSEQPPDIIRILYSKI